MAIVFSALFFQLKVYASNSNYSISYPNPVYSPTIMWCMEACETNSNLILAISENGFFAKSTDKGQNWDFYFVGFRGNRIHYPHPDTAFAAVDNTVLMTSNGGETWSDLFEESGFAAPNGVFHVQYEGNGRILAGGRQGTIFQSLDYGATWTILQNQSLNYGTIHSIDFFDNGLALAMTRNGRMMRSTNNFQTVSSINFPGLLNSTENGEMIKIGDTILVAYARGLYRSFDNGLNWTSHPDVGTNTQNGTLTRIDMRGDSVIVYATSRIFISTNRGQNFSILQSSINNFTNQFGASFASMTKLDNGAIYSFGLANYSQYNISSNTFSNLSPIKYNAHDGFSFVHFQNDTDGVIGTRIYPDNFLNLNKALVETNDGGLTWDWDGVQNPGIVNNLNGRIRSYHFFTATNGIGVTPSTNPNVYKLFNGGKQWAVLPNMPVSSAAFALNDDTIFTISGSNLHVSFNGGASHSSIATGISGTIEDLVFFDDQTGILVGQNGIFRTTNGGTTFTQTASSFSFNTVMRFGENGVIAGGSSVVRVSYNQGVSWTNIPVGTPLFVSSLFFNHGHMLDDQRGVIRSSIYMLVTKDGWQTYEKVYLLTRDLNGFVEMLPDESIVHVSSNSILKYTPIEEVISPDPIFNVSNNLAEPICAGDDFSIELSMENITSFTSNLDLFIYNGNDTIYNESIANVDDGQTITIPLPDSIYGVFIKNYTVKFILQPDMLTDSFNIQIKPNSPQVEIYEEDGIIYTEPMTTVDWFFEDIALTQNQTSNPVIFTGNYAVVNDNGFGCAAWYSDTIFLIFEGDEDTTGLNLLSKSDITIFPNPAKEFIVIKSSNNLPFSLSLIDMNGRELMSKGKQEIFHQIKINDLSKGIYLLHGFQNETLIFSRKILIE